MDDFRVGAVPSSDQYGARRPSDAVRRRREKHPHQEGGEAEETADGFEAAEASGASEAPAAEEPIEDYYVPSDGANEPE